MPDLHNLHIFTDGGSRGNPGPAAIAILIFDEKEKLLQRHSEFIGTATNNVAEYRAVLKALKLAARFKPKKVLCTLDSQVVQSQLDGSYKVKQEHLKELFFMVKDAERNFQKVIYRHVPRENKNIVEADEMLNCMLDRVSGKH